ncbi:MAG TPA: CopG family transcriptional regulator [Candidatus Korarchaeota archaeon]|nr:MAG: CopG family transcriptional regulator [Candidatus Korarchaeota archaeon]RLG45931.1 MAG: CopG family transcriptional regulator [Candidatus Korarchaeota archaeon]RLG46250.1 MAG: CopG family transcriptional regulator [Candidatus Korarchaeota archaeon]HDD68863.1 CopG family transcriptional regulator [Candidatus Korarchaeota archaeon]
MRKSRYTTVSIPVSLYEKVKKMIEGTGFSSVSDYVTYVLRELVASYEESKLDFTKEDEERIKRRLRALGYLE